MNDYTKLDLPFIEQVKGVLAEADKHKYSVSHVYSTYNKAFNKNDKPQTCSTCLRNRVRELRKWYAGYNKYKTSLVKAETPVLPIDEGKKGITEQDLLDKVELEDGTALLFVSEDGVKGIVSHEGGNSVKAGTYKLKSGDEIAVQPGGKATIKSNDLL